MHGSGRGLVHRPTLVACSPTGPRQAPGPAHPIRRYLASSRLGYDVAEQLVNGIRGGVARIEATVAADPEVAASIGETFADREFSIVDRTSWAVMQRLGLDEAVTFDQDFAIYRFGPQAATGVRRPPLRAGRLPEG